MSPPLTKKNPAPPWGVYLALIAHIFPWNEAYSSEVAAKGGCRLPPGRRLAHVGHGVRRATHLAASAPNPALLDTATA